MTDLFFCPERWVTDPMISSNIAKAVKVRGFNGKQTDAWQLGDWEHNYTALVSQIPIEEGWLRSGSEYRLCFWLNGGENAAGDEVCRLEIFGDAWEERLIFPLNRDRTRPLLYKNGWLLYAVPFTAPEAAQELTFRFVAAGAVCTIAGIPDMNMAYCEKLLPDEQEDNGYPQRPNVVFAGGYPADRKKVVLKPLGKEISVRQKTLKIAAAAAGVLIGTLVLHKLHRKKESTSQRSK